MRVNGLGHIIAITGGIGSGKSKVCSHLAKLCQLPVVDLDRICRQLLVTGAPGWLALKELLDDYFFTVSGELDRVAFRKVLFEDEGLRSRVDSLLHPLARKEMAEQVSRHSGPVLVEIPLLFEAGWQEDVQLIVVVYADPEVRVQRIVSRDNVSAEQARQEICAQYSLAEKALQAHHVTDNSGSWQETCLQLSHLADCLSCRG
ncbi:MAG: dephospho-CoA kinase [Thermodesulfobacteriota bacterium]|nr:dephospho-CoA kinase [Thermodesulfobacteriota bacterium]